MPENGFLSYPGRGAPIDLDPDTQLFTTSGTWTKPANARWVRVIIVGGGGGGQGGRKASNTSAGAAERPWGGGGGGGGGVSFIDVPADLLPSTVPVTIGAGGAGSAGATVFNSNPSAGSAGGNSSFGDFLSTTGGGGGWSGGTSRGLGHILGGRGGFSSFGNSVQPVRGLGTSGGSNGQQASSDQTVIEGPSPTFNAALPFSEPQKYGVIGTAGSAGAANFVGVRNFDAGAGTFGNGGGGGGAGRSDYDAGDGAVGGDGYCLVVSYGTPYRPINVQEFTSTGTWNKPTDPRLTQAKVFVIGGGAGGGSGRRWNRSNGAYLTGSGLALSRVSGCYASVPDSVATSITGDIDIKVKLNLYQWCHGPYVDALSGSGFARIPVSKWTASGNQRSWYLQVSTGGVFSFVWTTNGTTTLSATATSHLPINLNTTKWIRATLDVDNGAAGRTAKFYTSDDGTTWTQLGTTVTTAGTTSIFDSTAGLNMPGTDGGTANLLDGNLYRVIIENGYDGAGSVVLDANFENATAGAASFTESSVNAATVTINNASTNIGGGGGGGGGGVSYSELPLAILPNQVNVTVGTGGTGGAAVTTDYTFGNTGTVGGNSSFGAYVYSIGGTSGYGGNSTGGANATGGTTTEFSGDFGLIRGSLANGAKGGVGRSAANGDASIIATNDNQGCITSGGGGGAGINTSGTTFTGGVSSKPPGYGAIISDTSATANGVNVFASGPGMYGSSGGGGGNSSGTFNGGNGGRGSGGGGGGASPNGTNSGAGGNGGDGYVLVVCT